MSVFPSSKDGSIAKPRIIIFDLETLPNLPEALKVWPRLSAYPGLTLKATISSIICAGWKEYGEKKTHCINAWDFSRWKKDVNDDYSVCKEINKVLLTADAVVTHNGKRFDWKFLQTRLMYHGFKPMRNITHIDTCQIAKSNLYAFNNSLNIIGKLLVKDKKMENGGWDLWVNVHGKSKKAMKTMTEYCKQDVSLTEKCFIELIPLIKNMPNMNLWKNKKQAREFTDICPNCGSEDIKFNGYIFTKTTKYQRKICKDCGTTARVNSDGKKPRSI